MIHFFTEKCFFMYKRILDCISSKTFAKRVNKILISFIFFFHCGTTQRTIPLFKNCLKSKNFLKNFYGPFLWMGFNCHKARATLRWQFYQPREDQRLNQPWIHSVILNTGSLDCSAPIKGSRFLNCKLFLDFQESFFENILKIVDSFSSY